MEATDFAAVFETGGIGAVLLWLALREFRDFRKNGSHPLRPDISALSQKFEDFRRAFNAADANTRERLASLEARSIIWKGGTKMADFGLAFEVVLEHEGGYKLTNHKNDLGGPTYAGISSNSNPDWPGWAEIESNGSKPTTKLRDLVKKLYFDEYWTPVGGEKTQNQALATLIFSMAVLSGVGTASKLVQRAVEAVPDGKIGPNTLAKLNDLDPELVALRVFATRIERYDAIVMHRRSQRDHFWGWSRRALADLQNVGAEL